MSVDKVMPTLWLLFVQVVAIVLTVQAVTNLNFAGMSVAACYWGLLIASILVQEGKSDE